MSDNGSSNVKRTVEDSSQDRSFREEESSSSKRVRTESHEYSGVDFDTDAEAQLRCLMKTGDAGAIIGKAGSNVKRLRSDYSLSITLPNSMSVERVLTMRGSIKNIGNCLQDCFRLIHEDKMPDIDFKVECRMLVHSPFVGGLIGFKGERIKEIRERSNVEIKIFEDCCPGSTERVFKIDGSVSVVISSIMYILHLLNKPEIRARGRRLQEYDPLNNADLNDSAFRSQLSSSSYTHRSFADDITAPPKSFNHRGREADPREAPVFLEDAEGPVTSLTLTVAAESAGAIIGTGGRNINVARQRSRADIRVEDGKHDGAPRQVTITGTDSQIHYAKFLIQQFVKEDRAGRQKDTGRGDRDRERPETVPVGKAPPRSAAMGVPPGVKRGTDPRRGSSGSAAPPRLPSNGTGRGAANVFTRALSRPMSSIGKHCVILGAGFTGLSCAHYLRQLEPSCKVTLIEASNRVGGWLRSFKSDSGALHEIGARSIRNTHNAKLILNLIEEIGMQEHIAVPDKAAYDRYLYVYDRLQKIETSLFKRGPFKYPMLYYGLRHLMATLSGSSKSKKFDDETLHDFVTKQFGEELADIAFSAVVRGIYAGDTKHLSVKSCFPDFVRAQQYSASFVVGMMKLQRELSKNPEFQIHSELANDLVKKRVRMFTMRNGLGTVCEGILAHLQKSNDWFDARFQQKCEIIEKGEDKLLKLRLNDGNEIECDHVISTLDASELCNLLATSKSIHTSKESNQVLRTVSDVKYADVAVVNLEYPSKSVMHVPKAFGYLVPRVQRSNIIGVTFDSFSFPTVCNGSQDICRFSAMINQCSPDFADKDYLNMALTDFRKHLNVDSEPTFAAVNVNWKCIPQYALGHSKLIESFRNSFCPQVHFVGSLFHPPGLVDCSLNAFRTARLVSQS